MHVQALILLLPKISRAQINKPMTLRRLIRQLHHSFCKSNNRVAMDVRHG